MKELAYIKKKNFPPFLDKIIHIKPKDIPITAYARLVCQGCGLWNRAILCNPMLYKTYPQYRTINSSKKHFNQFDDAYIYVWKSNGSDRFWFKSEHDKYSHLRLRKVKSGRELKGYDIVSARWLTKMMAKIRRINEKRGFLVEVFTCGH